MFQLTAVIQWFADKEQLPLLVVDRKANIIVANLRARAIECDSCIRVENGRLSLCSQGAHAAFARMLSGSRREPLTLPLGKTGHTARIAHITGDHRGGVYAVFILRRSDLSESVQSLRTRLGLTNAEALVALKIREGASLGRIAKARSTSVNTIKTQTRSIFQKCRVHSRVALIRRLDEIERLASTEPELPRA